MQTFPTFSGNIRDTMVNYLLELDLLQRITGDATLMIGTSPRIENISQKPAQKMPYTHELYPYL